MFRHPNSTPARPSGQSDPSMLKPPKAPERPLVPYMRFSRKLWAKVRAEHPDSQLWDIGKIIGQMWRDAPESEKLAYQQEYEIEKAEYEKTLKAYHNSAAYQQYLSAKNRAKMADKSGTVGSVIANSRGRLESGGVVIQPAEDEEPTDLSSRRVAAVRFDRNHRLIADLFNGSVVTDTRTIVVQNRIDMLKKQANSLSTHQSKLEEELKNLEATFNEKKRQLETASDEFAARLKKVCEERPQIDEAKYMEMTEEWEKKLLKAYKEFTAKEEERKKRQIVEREQLAEETPILYSLTVGESSPSPKNKEKDLASPAIQNSPITSTLVSAASTTNITTTANTVITSNGTNTANAVNTVTAPIPVSTAVGLTTTSVVLATSPDLAAPVVAVTPVTNDEEKKSEETKSESMETDVKEEATVEPVKEEPKDNVPEATAVEVPTKQA